MEKPQYTVTKSRFNTNLIVVVNIKAKHDQDFILLYLRLHTVRLLKLLIVYQKLLKTWSSDNEIQEFSLA